MSLQVSLRLELSLTVVTLVDVHVTLLHVDLSLDKVSETLRAKVTSLPVGHFGHFVPVNQRGLELLSTEADYPDHRVWFRGLKRL